MQVFIYRQGSYVSALPPSVSLSNSLHQGSQSKCKDQEYNIPRLREATAHLTRAKKLEPDNNLATLNLEKVRVPYKACSTHIPNPLGRETSFR